MANLVLVVDPNAERRDRFTAKIEPLLPPIEGLRTERCASGDFCALWAREPRAPISSLADGQGVAAIWGDAICANGTERVEASSLRGHWRDANSSELFDGFHAAAVYDQQNGLLVGCDLLGLFPLYYWSSSDVVLVGSSAELFQHHAVFRKALSPAGLVGILLTSHLLDGQTLLEGVKRLDAGALLVCRSGSLPREVRSYRLPVSRRYFDLQFSRHLDVLDRVLERATAHHAPPEHQHTLLLSGGLDSRMLGGYLAQNGTPAVALTLGARRDLEMRTARQVARSLKFSHRMADTPFEHYPLYAGLQAKWEQLANGFSTIRTWGLPAVLQSLPARVVSGYVTDAIVGGPLVHYLPDQAQGLSFERVFAYYNRVGFRPTVLAALLRRDVFAGLLEQAVGRLREVYESYSDLDSQRAWCFELYHRQRFHVGGSAWRLCFGAWPVLPAIDRGVLEAVAAMPAATIASRRAQRELVVRRFPDLAALPLDRNSYDTRPLQPRLGWLLFNPVRRSLGRVVRSLPRAWRQERRYYYRVYDINNRGWLAVRRKAEPLRSRVEHLFERDALSRLLPPPETLVQCEDAIVDTSGMKLLLGFILWCEDLL